MKLVITVENKSPRKLKQLRDWLYNAIVAHGEDKEPPIKWVEWKAEVKK